MNVLRAAAAAIALAVTPASAGYYDPQAEFSIASNPNGVWQYGYGTPGSSFTLFTATSAQLQPGYDTPGWYSPSQSFGVPMIYRNDANVTISPLATLNIAPGTVVVHPGNGTDQAAILQFIAPAAGQYDFFANIVILDLASSGIAAKAWLNGGQLSSVVVSPYAAQSMARAFSMATGDVLSFSFDANGSFLSDTTSFEIGIHFTPLDTTTGVPEPASLALFAAGLGCIGLVRRRKPA